MFPIEIFSTINSFTESTIIPSTSKWIRNTMREYSSFIYSMTEEQRRLYDALITCEKNRIHMKTLPGNGSSIILINYMNQCIKDNERILVLTKDMMWQNILQSYFDDYFLFISDEDVSKEALLTKKIMMMTCGLHMGKEYDRVRNYAPSIIISCGRYNFPYLPPEEHRFLSSNLKKCILSSYEVMSERRESWSTDEIYAKNILPFPSYFSFFLSKDSALKIFSFILGRHSQFTLMGVDDEDIEVLRMQRVRVFTEDSVETFLSLEETTKAVLVYTEKFLQNNTPSISGVVVINTIYGGPSHKELDYLFYQETYVPVLQSKTISHIYYYRLDDCDITENHFSYRMPAAILLQDAHIRMCFAGFTMDPFLDFMEDCYTEYRNYGDEYNAELIKENDETFYRWCSKDWIQKYYLLYKDEYSEETHIMDLIKKE